MHVFTVQEATKSDIPSVIEIADVCDLSRWSKQDLIAEIKLEKSIFLRLLDEKMSCIGFILGRVVPGAIWDWDADLYNIGVLPHARRKGGGELLMAEFLNRSRKMGAKSVWLDVRESNTSAIAFYSKFGFISEGIRKNFYRDPTENALLMNLKIENLKL
ncbi:MAG: ribosomal protein S18-alanine N-acetyltransferase [Acidobacteria bacterium]|nr:ribosomal protein S18-alanine N-acetyltransferase [Acidobacteriota bacterium]